MNERGPNFDEKLSFDVLEPLKSESVVLIFLFLLLAQKSTSFANMFEKTIHQLCSLVSSMILIRCCHCFKVQTVSHYTFIKFFSRYTEKATFARREKGFRFIILLDTKYLNVLKELEDSFY